jgi:hypothetical protein
VLPGATEQKAQSEVETVSPVPAGAPDVKPDTPKQPLEAEPAAPTPKSTIGEPETTVSAPEAKTEVQDPERHTPEAPLTKGFPGKLQDKLTYKDTEIVSAESKVEGSIELSPDWWKTRPTLKIEKPVSDLDLDFSYEWHGKGDLPAFRERTLEAHSGPSGLKTFGTAHAPGKLYKGPEGVEGYEELSRRRRVPGVKVAIDEHGSISQERAGTFDRKGVHYNELNAAEISHGLLIDRDPKAGMTRKVTYRIDADSRSGDSASPRSFSSDIATEGVQSSDKAYIEANRVRVAQGLPPLNRGHLAQREAFKSSPESLAAADHWTNVVPMMETLNQGKRWRTAEERSFRYATKLGSVIVEVEPIYPPKPDRLSDGTPIPVAIRRRVISPDGKVLEDRTYPNI